MSNWYAFFCLDGDEEKLGKIIMRLYNNCSRIIIPKRELIERKGGNTYKTIHTLFPGCVLVETEQIDDKSVESLRKITSVDKNWQEPMLIPEEEIQVLFKLMNSNNTVEFSDIKKDKDGLKVLSGPLVGFEQYLGKFNHRKKRIKLHIKFLHKQWSIDVGANLIE